MPSTTLDYGLQCCICYHTNAKATTETLVLKRCLLDDIYKQHSKMKIVLPNFKNDIYKPSMAYHSQDNYLLLYVIILLFSEKG